MMRLITSSILLATAVASPGLLVDGPSHKYCGIYATGSRAAAQDLQSQLLECSDEWDTQWTLGGTDDEDIYGQSNCVTMACEYERHTQFWLCNDNPYIVTKNCTEVAYWIQRIIDECCTDDDALSGQYFLGDGTNIAIAYSWCHTDERPDDEGKKGRGQCVGSA